MKPAQLKERNYAILGELSIEDAVFLTTVLDDYSYTLMFELMINDGWRLRAHLCFYENAPEGPNEQLINSLIVLGWEWVTDTLLFRKKFIIDPKRPGLFHVDEQVLVEFFGMHYRELRHALLRMIQEITPSISPRPSFGWSTFNFLLIVYYDTMFGGLVETDVKRSSQCVVKIPLKGVQSNYRLHITWDIAPKRFPVNASLGTDKGRFYADLLDVSEAPHLVPDYTLHGTEDKLHYMM